MNIIILLAALGVTGIIIITTVVSYQFIQQQQDRRAVIDLLNPSGYNNNAYQECWDSQKKPDRSTGYVTSDRLAEIICEKYKK